MDERLSGLFAESAGALFEQAEERARGRPTLFSSPLGLNDVCTTDPPCRHCAWISRYRLRGSQPGPALSLADIVERARAVESLGIQRMHLASGWVGRLLPDFFYEATAAVTRATSLEVYGVFGPVAWESLAALKTAGMAGYWCPMEVVNEKLFAEIRPGDLGVAARIETLRNAKELGLKTWSGFVFGVGETAEDVARHLELMRELRVDSYYVQPFQPCPYTDMEWASPARPYEWARTTAIARIYLDDVEVFAPPDQAPWAARAGANGFSPVVIRTPESNIEGLREVRRATYALAEQVKSG